MSPSTIDPALLEGIVRDREKLCESDRSLRHEFYVLSAILNLGELSANDRENALAALDVPHEPARRLLRGKEALRRLTAAHRALYSREETCQD